MSDLFCSNAGNGFSRLRSPIPILTVLLRDERPLQDDPSLLVPLAVLCGELVDPAQLLVAAFAGDVPYDVAAGQHHPILHLAGRKSQR